MARKQQAPGAISLSENDAQAIMRALTVCDAHCEGPSFEETSDVVQYIRDTYPAVAAEFSNTPSMQQTVSSVQA